MLKNKNRLFIGIIYTLLFLFSLYPYRDYDWGWHYRMGEYFIKHGHIMWQDIFSWTMSGYVWVNHEWMYDPLLYLLYTIGGFFTLSVAGALVSVLIFFVATHRFKLSYIELGFLAVFYYVLTSGVYWQGLRSQMIGILMLVTLIDLLMWWASRADEKAKTLVTRLKNYALFPAFFLLWANLHGTVVLGILFFGLFIILQFFSKTRTVKSKKLFETLFISFLISIFATFINPFFYRVYFEALNHYNSPLLTKILEWTPAQFPSSFFSVFLVYTLFLLILCILKRSLKYTFYMLIAAFLFYLAFGARRYMAIYVAMTLPLAAMMLVTFKLPFEKYRATPFLFILCILICFEIALFQKLPSYNIYKFFGYTIEDYCFYGSHCSEKLTKILLKNPPIGKGFNFYDWGGYLIGRGVPAKLFIDGRMHLWEEDSYQPFAEYDQMFYGGDIKKFNSYNFDWIIVPSGSAFLKNADKKGLEGTWKVIYQDKDATYAVREKEGRKGIR